MYVFIDGRYVPVTELLRNDRSDDVDLLLQGHLLASELNISLVGNIALPTIVLALCSLRRVVRCFYCFRSSVEVFFSNTLACL